MRAALVALAVILVAAPLASAQAPTPDELVTLACATAGSIDPDARNAIPLCPAQDPAGPAEPQEEGADDEHDHGAAPEPQAAARDISDEAQEAAQGSAQDPQSAPGRAAGLVATIRQAIEDLLRLPAAAGGALRDVGVGIRFGFVEAAHATGAFFGGIGTDLAGRFDGMVTNLTDAATAIADTVATTAETAWEGANGAFDSLRAAAERAQAWFHGLAPSERGSTRLPEPGAPALPREGLLLDELAGVLR